MFDSEGFKEYKKNYFLNKTVFSIHWLTLIGKIEQITHVWDPPREGSTTYNRQRIYRYTQGSDVIYLYKNEPRSVLGWIFKFPFWLAYTPIIIAFQIALMLVSLPIALLYYWKPGKKQEKVKEDNECKPLRAVNLYDNNGYTVSLTAATTPPPPVPKAQQIAISTSGYMGTSANIRRDEILKHLLDKEDDISISKKAKPIEDPDDWIRIDKNI